jgi:flagellar motor switch protein FliG
MPALREDRIESELPEEEGDGPTLMQETVPDDDVDVVEEFEDGRDSRVVGEDGEGDGSGDDVETVTGARRAAIFVLSLEETVATQLLRCLSDDELGCIAAEIAELGVVDTDSVASVMAEFRELERLHGLVREGGLEQAARLVEQSFPQERARRVVRTLEATHQRLSFAFLAGVDTDVLLSALEEEHPQTVCVILSHMVPQQAAELLECMEPERRQDLLERVASLDGVSAEAVRRIEQTLREQLEAARMDAARDAGGIKAVADILRASGGGGASLLDGLRSKRPELADEVDKHLFVFADIARLEDRALQIALAQIDNDCLALALKNAAPNISERILESLSRRSLEAVEDEMNAMGPVRLSEVESAREKVVQAVLRLEAAGEVFIPGRGPEENRLLY